MAQSGRLATPSGPATLSALLRDHVRLAVGPSEGVALACAHRATTDLDSLDLELVTRADQRLTAVKLVPGGAGDVDPYGASAAAGRDTAAFGAGALASIRPRRSTGRRSPGNHAVVLGVLSACARRTTPAVGGG